MIEVASVPSQPGEKLHKPNAVKPRMTFPDGLRAIASLLVVLPHSVGMFWLVQTHSLPTQWMISVSGYGTLGVQIFFVLSGFVIAFTLKNQQINLRYLGVFTLRRSVRLDPSYWSAIALMLAYIALQAKVSPGHAHLPAPGVIVAHLFYLQDVLRLPQIDVVFWTLCIEVQLYIAYCSFLGFVGWVGNKARMSLQTAGVASYLLALLWPAKVLPLTPGFFFGWWYAFMAGVLVWWACEGRLGRRTAVLLLLPLAALAVYQRNVVVGAVGLSAGLLLVCAQMRGLHRWLAYRPLLFIGRLSYCLYLVHVPVAGVILALLTRMPHHSEALGYFGLLLIYAVSILLAFLLHRFVEVPSLRWSQQMKSLYRNPPAKIAVS